MEYISESLASFSEGMSKQMKRSFNFMHVAGDTAMDVTSTTLSLPPNIVSDDEEEI